MPGSTGTILAAWFAAVFAILSAANAVVVPFNIPVSIFRLAAM